MRRLIQFITLCLLCGGCEAPKAPVADLRTSQTAKRLAQEKVYGEQEYLRIVGLGDTVRASGKLDSDDFRFLLGIARDRGRSTPNPGMPRMHAAAVLALVRNWEGNQRDEAVTASIELMRDSNPMVQRGGVELAVALADPRAREAVAALLVSENANTRRQAEAFMRKLGMRDASG